MPMTTTCSSTETSMPNSPISMDSSTSWASPRSRSKRLRMRPWGTLSKKAMGARLMRPSMPSNRVQASLRPSL
ncbi:hypothetical protein D3C79_742610 [compost metagenome]